MINVSFLRIILFGSRFYGLSGKARRQFQGPYYQVSHLGNIALTLRCFSSFLLRIALFSDNLKKGGDGGSPRMHQVPLFELIC